MSFMQYLSLSDANQALQDIAEGVEELEAECYRLRAELKTSNAERDHARRLFCEWSAGSDRPGEAKEDIARVNGWRDLYKNTNQHQPNGKHTGEQP